LLAYDASSSALDGRTHARPPIITLEQKSDSEWTVPAGSKLTDAQYKSFEAGNLYVNIYSAEHKGGEIRLSSIRKTISGRRQSGRRPQVATCKSIRPSLRA
jgi:hypothetical protein